MIKSYGESPENLERTIKEKTKKEINNAFKTAELAPFPEIERSVSYEYAQ